MYMCIHMYFSTNPYQHHHYTVSPSLLRVVLPVVNSSHVQPSAFTIGSPLVRLVAGLVAQSHARSLGELAASAATFAGGITAIRHPVNAPPRWAMA